MTRTWIEAIYDRTYGNIQSLQQNPNHTNNKGAWNAKDLNRIENNTAYCAEWLLEKKIVQTPPSITVRENNYWTGEMIPSKGEVDRIINNVRLLISLSSVNPAIADRLPNLYAATQINYVFANQIEFALELMHNQPKLPLHYWNLTIEFGIVTTIIRDGGEIEIVNASEALVAENEIVTIRGVEYGDNAQYQTFTYWSGSADDLGLLEDYNLKETTFTMPYRDVKFTANFETHIPRTLTINNGYISVDKDPNAESGPSTAKYLAGDEIMIIADVAASGQAFYEWTGTQEGLDNIVGVTTAEDPSTAILTMPDCDVTLTPHYIEAGQHSVTVTNGTGSGWYDYGEYVVISATVPDHYGFDNWSGNTSYLDDIYNSYQSFKMKDKNISFRANYSYRYSYNSVQVIDGLISVNNENVSQANNLREGLKYTLIPTPPNDSQGLYGWEVEGFGSVSGNTLTIGDGNAIVTGIYKPYRNITIKNINNNGEATVYRVVQDRDTGEISTSSSQGGNYKFVGWYENNTVLSTNPKITITAGEADREIEAKYEYYPNYTITVQNRNNNGEQYTTTIVSGEKFSLTTNEEQDDYLFVNWNKDGSSFLTSTRIEFTVIADATIEAVYRPKETYTLTVTNGTGSGDYKERQWVNITANVPDEGASFTGWSTSGIRSINNKNASSTTVQMGRQNANCTATYSNLRNITVTTHSGTNTYQIVQGNRQSIKANPAPDTWEFKQWSVVKGDATFANYLNETTYVYANLEDSEVVAEYKEIPYFTVVMEDGYIWNGTDWVTEATLLRDSTNEIKMKPAPTGKQFFQWEIYVNGVLQTDENANDVLEPLAERTRLSKLSRNVTLKATFYTPDTETKYTLTIERKDGSSDQHQSPAGTNIDIEASVPNEGMEFHKWEGDTAYVAGGIYNEKSYVHMPAQNIHIKESFVPEGYIPTFNVTMKTIYAECCYETEHEDPETGEITITKHWVTEHSFQEGTVVEIRTKDIAPESYFVGWNAINHDTEEDARVIIAELAEETTTITVPNYDVDIEPQIALKETYRLTVIDGATSGDYYKGKRADIYFTKEDTNDVHYIFNRWTGETVSQLELYDGGMFNVLVAGTETEPQYIKMPAEHTEIAANYKSLYRLSLTNGTINSIGLTEGYYEANTTLEITADPAPEGMKFQYWIGDTDVLESRFDPTTTIKTVSGVTTLTAKYSTDADQNSTGYVETSLIETTTISNNEITVISGTIDIGFLLTDSNGHVYIVTSVDAENNISTIYRMTKIIQGGNVYG